MSDQEQTAAAAAIKVTRKRKRLYEPSVETVHRPESVSMPARPPESPPALKVKKADEIILDHMLWSAGLAILPIPLVGTVGITAVTLRMLKKLCQLYGLPFEQQRGKSVIGALLGTLQTQLLTRSLWKLIPGLGIVGGVISTATIAGAMTYAVGNVFVMHFETGGTLLNFDPAVMHTHFVQKYQQGQRISASFKSS